MIRIAKTLPGELIGDVNPEDYGFKVIKEDPPGEAESARRVAQLYEQIKERTGITLVATERYLAEAAERSTSGKLGQANGSNGNGAGQ
jgi:hypothetical protein